MAASLRDGREHRIALGADGQAEHVGFDIAAGDEAIVAAIVEQQRGAYVEMRVRRMRAPHRGIGELLRAAQSGHAGERVDGSHAFPVAQSRQLANRQQ